MRRIFLRAVIVSLSVIGLDAGAATFVVVNTNNDGPGSLREAVERANASSEDDTINFDVAGGGPHVIELTTELPAIEGNTAIVNDRATDDGVTIRRSTAAGTPAFSIFKVSPERTIELAGLTLTNGVKAYFQFRSPEHGGAIDALGSRVVMRECTVTDSVAGIGGGIAAESVSITRSTFIGNRADEYGGALLTTSNGEITNCTFTANVQLPRSGSTQNAQSKDSAELDSLTPPPIGGAITALPAKSPEAQLVIMNCTFVRNTAARSASGGAVGTAAYGSPALAIGSSVFDSNGGYSVSGYGRITSLGHNITTDPPDGVLRTPTDRNRTDPKLVGLQRNGGRTPTHALAPDSPAIDAANEANAPAVDQRGFKRSGASDVGAFEFNGVPPTSFANISTRLRVGTSDNVLIGGFIVSGSEAKRLMIRGIGPSLAMTGRLEDPKVEVYDSLGAVIASNDDWQQQGAAAQEISDSGIAPSHPLESALVRNFEPGAYTAVVRGVNDATGIGLVELYELNRAAHSRLANISTRGLVEAGTNVLIGGVIIVGPDPQRVLLRAIGPSLPKAGKLADPQLQLIDGNGAPIADNDNWRTEEAEVQATGIPPSHDLESALVRTLSPGSYTAVLRGKNGSTGIALVELYALP